MMSLKPSTTTLLIPHPPSNLDSKTRGIDYLIISTKPLNMGFISNIQGIGSIPYHYATG